LIYCGLSILVSAVAAVKDLHPFFNNHESYHNVSSTILRVTKDPDRGAMTAPDDHGIDPWLQRPAENADQDEWRELVR
jgi:hypothetical protein